MRKVAIIYGISDAYEEFFAHTITDWAEISEDDYRTLRTWISRTSFGRSNAVLLEAPLSQSDTVPKAIAECLEIAEKIKREDEARTQKEDERRRLREEKKKERERQTFIRLKERFDSE